MLLSLLLLSLFLLLLLLLFELVLDPRFPARDIDDAKKFKKVNVEIAPDDSQAGSDSTSLYTTYLRPTEGSRYEVLRPSAPHRSIQKTETVSRIFRPDGHRVTVPIPVLDKTEHSGI